MYMSTSDKGTVYRYIKQRRLNTADIIGTLDSIENATGPSFVAT